MDQQPTGPFAGTPQPPSPTPVVPAAPTETKRGNIAEGIFDEVERMTAGGAMNRSEAFEAISTRTGRRAGTVAANYYRIARKRGTVAPRGTRGPGRPAGAGRKASGDAAAIIARLEAATKDLYHLPPEEDAKIPTVCHSLDQALEYLDKDRAFLTKGGVFTDSYIDAYIDLKMQEVTRFRMTTHPLEFEMYYSL
jgi:hypothetical protein